MESALLLIVVACYAAAAFAWPTLRVWRRTGVWPVVFDRAAAPAQWVFGQLSRVLLLIVVAATIAYAALGPEPLGLWSAGPAARVAAWLAILSGFLLTVLAQRQMGASWRVGIDDRPTDLVEAGPFLLVRNPIFTGLLLFLAGYGCLLLSWWSIALWIATAAALRLQIALEERHLIAQHGDRYLAYASRVGRLVPLLGRIRAGKQTETRGRA